MVRLPPRWDDERLASDSATAVQLFREERVTEPLEAYSGHFQQARVVLENLLEETVDLSLLTDQAFRILSNLDTMESARYLTGPPMSKDDLETVAEVTLSHQYLLRNNGSAPNAMSFIQMGLDRNRFPWVSENREPTEAERVTAIVSTASLIAARRVATNRANTSKNEQEDKVKAALLEQGFQEAPTRNIGVFDQAPQVGFFCGESLLGSRKADVVVRLWDGRVLALECKVSNSGTNSIKRLNNDAAVKAKTWIREFGDRSVVPSAMLAGVFRLRNLKSAQQDGLTIWWSHDLSTLMGWIESTRPAGTSAVTQP